MKLATSTNIMDKVVDTFGAISAKECVLCCKKAGFEVLDYNFCDQGRAGHPITFLDWQENLADFKAFCDKENIPLLQTHLHMYDPKDPRIEDHGWEREMLRRTVEGSGILKTKWAVAHPLHEQRKGYTKNDYLQLNLEFWGPIAERAAQMGFGLSFENMVQHEGAPYEYACTAEDLIELTDAFKISNVGINWDFGHANISVPDELSQLRLMGKRLKSTHIADNHGLRDEHLPPFYGNLNWHKLMQVLAEIGYKGDFTYEVQAFTSPLPKELRETQLLHLAEIGKYLINVFKEA